jgi:predicted DNA-binding transcriptional regulator AlpA
MPTNQPTRFISRKLTRERTTLSEREQKRKEARGTFPLPVKIGAGAHGRVAHVESEIDDWLARQIAERDRKIAEPGIAAPSGRRARESQRPAAADNALTIT